MTEAREKPAPSTLESQIARHKAIEAAPEHKEHTVLRHRVDTWKDLETGAYIACVAEKMTQATTEADAVEAAKDVIETMATFALTGAVPSPASEAREKPAPKCWPWSHEWTKWQMWERGELAVASTQIMVGKYETQRRECRKCGKSQLREIQA